MGAAAAPAGAGAARPVGGAAGANMAKRFARFAAIADETTHVSWARLVDGHAAVLQRAWRASAAAATWRMACHAAMRIQLAWRAARGLWGPTSRAGAGRRAPSRPAR